jgi:hypothetical protein
MIYDARAYVNALANRVTHGGFENVEYYDNCEIEFCNIDNIHAVRSNYHKVLALSEEITDY